MKPSFQNKKSKGFTLIEVILAMAISFVILSVIAVIMGFSLNILKSDFDYNRSEASVYYAQDYIEKEISRAYKVYEPHEFPVRLRSNNLGFVIEILQYGKNDDFDHDYVYYYLDNVKIKRILYSSYVPIEKKGDLYYQGTNTICDNVTSIASTYFDKENNYILLNFSFEENGSQQNRELGVFVEARDEED